MLKLGAAKKDAGRAWKFTWAWRFPCCGFHPDTHIPWLQAENAGEPRHGGDVQYMYTPKEAS